MIVSVELAPRAAVAVCDRRFRVRAYKWRIAGLKTFRVAMEVAICRRRSTVVGYPSQMLALELSLEQSYLSIGWSLRIVS